MTDLTAQFSAFREANPTTRIRTAAREMGTSEAQLVETGVDGPAVRLEAPAGGWREMLHEIQAFGSVMALTRNDACVHERHGVYANVSTDLPHGMALLLNDDIDLRLFCARWASAFAVTNGERRSLQIFDRAGDAVHKIYLTPESDEAAFDAFVEAHRAADPAPLAVEPRKVPAADRPDDEVDAAAFLEGWAGLQDTHDFSRSSARTASGACRRCASPRAASPSARSRSRCGARSRRPPRARCRSWCSSATPAPSRSTPAPCTA